MAQSIELKDFSGGITDYYLYAPPNKLKQCDNLLINHYQGMGKPFNRPGSELFDADWPQPHASRINTCFKYKGILFVIAVKKLFIYDPSSPSNKWIEVKNPGGEDPFPDDNRNYYNYSFWNDHILITGSKLGSTTFTPLKIVIESLSLKTVKIMAAGLPSLSYLDPNVIKVTKPLGGTSTDPTYLYKLVFSQKYSTDSAVFEDIGEPSRSIEVKECKAISATNTVTLENIPAIVDDGVDPIYDSYRLSNIKIDIYRTAANGTVFYYVGSVNNGTTTFVDSLQDNSPLIFAYDTKASFPVPGVLGNLYFARDTSDYWKWVGAPTSAYVLSLDETRAATLNQTLYTTGGVVENGAPPQARCVHIKNDTAYYGNTFLQTGDTEEEYNYRVYQSVIGDIDSVPASFYVDVDDEIISISSTKSNVIILCRNSVYRLDGAFDELGRGGMIVERISDTAGCISVQGTVQALDGVFWLGRDGAYYTDGFKVIKLNEDHDKRYKSFISPAEYTSSSSEDILSRAQKVQGKYDKKKNRIWWIMQSSITAEDTDMCYVLDLNWGIQQNATFTTISGKTFYPSAIEFDDGDMIRCHKNGYVFLHTDGLYTDPQVNPSAPVSTWNDETIIYTLETVAFDFGTSATRKYVTQVNVTCESETNLSLQIISNNDDDRRIANLLPIRYRGNIFWGEPDVYWNDPKLDWNKQGLIHEKRLFPAKSLRCNFKSIALTNAQVAIVSSDLLKTGNVNSTLKRVELIDRIWPTHSVGYYIAFEDDNYQTEYEIVARTDSLITYSDPLNTSISGLGKKWVIRGKPKGEILNLINMSAVYEMSGPSLHPFRKSDSGEVGT